MAIQGVDTKCYILALFIRDDDERFLLGSGQFEFKDSQKQFEANAIQNDVVEVQGNDGYLLAGQVRRSGTQNFDGYVGDGTMAKTEVEENRRKFFAFYQKNHFYRVVYVFPDGTAIQRKRGFLVDDPTVQELYQQYPEYHVALNFEDVNYYTYSENEQGEEIYAEEAIIDLSVLRATGGLIWDEYGAVSDGFTWGGETTASGTNYKIQNELDLPAAVTDAKIYGGTVQQTYTGKNLLNLPNSTRSSGGIDWTNTDGISTGSGTATGGSSLCTNNISFDLQPGSYTFSIQNTLPYEVQLNLYNGSSWITVGRISSGRKYAAFSVTGTYTQWRMGVAGWSTGATINLTIKQPMLEAGGAPTDYEPYVGGVPAPNPDYPQDINVVTGNQAVSISNDNSNNHSYTVDLGTTELCKIGDYQDYIYKSGADWYVHKETGKLVADGSEAGWNSSAVSGGRQFYVSIQGISTVSPRIIACDNFYYITGSTAENTTYINSSGLWVIYKPTSNGSPVATSTAEFKTWLGTHNTTLYYALATPTDTKITDNTLIAQLNALGKMKLFVGENNVLVSASGTNLPGELTLTYYTTLDASGSGYVWEEGGSGGPTMVEIDSITNVYPIWKVFGPAVNPELSILTTNTTLVYNGTVASGQYLIIDMMNKTAKLNGTSVIGNVSGDWVNLRPGVNRGVYATDNSDTPSSIIEWQEVVG